MDLARSVLIQRVEDEFRIVISDEELSRLRTAGDLHALLAIRLNRGESLLSARALYVTRRALADGLEISQEAITPATRVAELVPEAGRAERWNAVTKSAGGLFPELRLSRRLQDRVMLTSMGLATPPVIALWWALYELDWIRGVWALLFSMPAALAFLLIESRVDKHLLRAAAARWANELPRETVKDLAQELEELNPPVLREHREAGMGLSSDELWRKLERMIRETGSEQVIILPRTPLGELQRVH